MGNLKDKSLIISYTFSWNYAVTSPNTILLKLELVLNNGDLILLRDQLYAWQDIPNNWDYSLNDKQHKSEDLIVNGNLKRTKMKFEKLKL